MVIAAIICVVASPAQSTTWQEFHPDSHPKTFTVRQDDVRVRLVMPWSGSDEADAKITVAFGKAKPVALGRDSMRIADYGIGVGIVKLNPRDTRPTVLISGFSGGAHCCATLQVVSLVNGKPVIAKLHPRDGDIVHELPTDIDGDGTLDIRWADDSLLYEFASHAGSRSVPRIINIRNGRAIDVSREPRFAKIYRDFAQKTLKGCRNHADIDRNGSCAAYAYGMAVLGKPEEGIRLATALAGASDWLPKRCTVRTANGICPKGKERTFSGFESALRWIMEEHGYLLPPVGKSGKRKSAR
jgi:hypothetical protein